MRGCEVAQSLSAEGLLKHIAAAILFRRNLFKVIASPNSVATRFFF
jgi:hypothetical protein